MATIIKLTYTITGKSTLLNADKITTAFRIFEKSTKKYATRVNFDGESYLIVDEELQTIKQLIEDASTGEFSTNDWVEIDTGEGSQEFHERLENNYHRNNSYDRNHSYGGQRRNNYNNHYNNRY